MTALHMLHVLILLMDSRADARIAIEMKVQIL